MENYFQSVVAHELAHSLFDKASCPFKACVIANEYVAYAMQVMSLTSEQKTEFVEHAHLDRPISRDELSLTMYLMAPNLFAQKTWVHLNQRSDVCSYLRQFLDGTMVLDRERF